MLSGIDLNLLVALDALITEESVTRAAARIGLSQPAMSHALARLRVLLDDRILVRAGTRMRASARAKELARPVAVALAEIERALFGAAAFDLRRVERSIRIASAEFGQLVLVPPLALAVSREAPGVELEVVPPGEPVDRALTEGRVDLAIVVGPPKRRASHKARGLREVQLLEERFVCLVRKDHPARRLTLRRYADLAHVVISPLGRVAGAGDVALAERGLRRRVTLTVPSVLAATQVVRSSDAVLTVGERAAKMLSGSGLTVLEPPLPLDRFALHLLWHERHAGDPLHEWIRSVLVASAARC